MFKQVVIASYLYIPRDEIRDIGDMKDQLTEFPKYGKDSVKLYNDALHGWFGVPLYHYRNLDNIADKITDNRAVGAPITVEFTSKFREGQVEVIDKFSKYVASGKTGFILRACPGFGKSHPKGTDLLMFDGSTKKVENIIVGDLLMGPDSAPRKVLNTHRGFGPIYKIVPNKGEPWECNEPHVLSLKLSPFFQQNGNRKGGRIRRGEIVNIPLNEYLKKSNTFKHRFKLWRSAINFPNVEVVDPYLIGLYLADGTKNNNSVLCCGEIKKPAIDYVRKNWSIGQDYFAKGAWYLSLLDFAPIRKRLIHNGERNIPDAYLINSRENRLLLLAGILDGDGHLIRKTVFELACKDTLFSSQILFLCRSLGFAAYASRTIKSIKKTGFMGKYWRITISGNTETIPTKVISKQANKRRQKKDPLVTGFSVNYDRDDYYYGIALEADGLYLLGDFTVTHNTVVAADIISLLGRTALVIVPRSNLISQWVDRLCQHTSLLPSEIGTACGGKATWQGKKVVVGLVHTLALDRFGDAFKRYFGVVIYDEVDRSVPPQTFAPVVSMFPSKYRIGVSATMKRQDGMEVVFHKHVGQVFLQGVASNRMKPKVLIHVFTGSSGPVFGKTAIRKRGQLISRLAANGERNALIARYAKSILMSGRRLVILSDRIKQLIELKTILIANGWAKDRDVGFYVRTLPGRGELSEKERKRIANVCKVILGTYGLFALGTDIPDLAGLIYATPMSETEQSKGRIEREFKGKLQPVVVDIVDQFYDNAARWGYKRERQYVAEGLKIRKIRS